MITTFRWLMKFFLLISTLAVGLVLFIYFLISQSLPNYNRLVNSPNLISNVEVVRDIHAIPHIFGVHDADIFFALGYVHAQERLWQMLMLRRTAQGKLSELFGERSLETDKLMRTLNLYEIANESAAVLNMKTLNLLESYANGINKRLKDIKDLGLGRGAPQFFLFSPKVSPWTPVDSLAILKLMALNSTDKASIEVLRANLLLNGLSQKKITDLFPDLPKTNIQLSNLFSDSPKKGFKKSEKKIIAQKLFWPLPKIGKSTASNVWAAMPFRTASNATLAASDPHSNLEAPSKWMLARLDLESGSVIGGTIPGIPAILIGRSNYLAWGTTNAFLDDQDIIIEKVNPKNEDEYFSESGLKKFQKYSTIINIKNLPGISHTFFKSENGPILPESAYNVGSILPKGHKAALSWTGFENKDRSIEVLINNMGAKSFKEAERLFPLYVAPAYNLMMANEQNIALFTIGKVPKRHFKNSTRGAFPSAGWLKNNSWEGYQNYFNNPKIENPIKGIIRNTNNKMVEDKFPFHFSYDWGDNQRILRLDKLLSNREFHTRESFVEIQNDIISVSARILIPLLGRTLWYSQPIKADETLGNIRRQALDLLANWNGEMSIHLPEPLIYATWTQQFQKQVLVDELSENIRSFQFLKSDFLERVLKDIDGASSWCNIIQTPTIEDCDLLAKNSLDDALTILTQQYGAEISDWRWGDANKAVHIEQTFGHIPIVSFFTNITHDMPGSENTLLRAKFFQSKRGKFITNNSSSLKVLFDFSSPENSLFMISTGQSGHILSRHYDDLSELWQRGQYIPMTMDSQLIRSGSAGIMKFSPEP